jgi:hypothetical protein
VDLRRVGAGRLGLDPAAGMLVVPFYAFITALIFAGFGAGELQINEQGKSFTVKGKTVKEGDYLAFDGLTGEVKIAKVASQPSEILQVVAGEMKPEASDIYRRFQQILSWSDKARTLDIPRDLEVAAAFLRGRADADAILDERGTGTVLLLLPGLLWLAVFFLVPMYYLGYTSLESGDLFSGYTFTWAWDNYSSAFTRYREQFFRSLE